MVVAVVVVVVAAAAEEAAVCDIQTSVDNYNIDADP